MAGMKHPSGVENPMDARTSCGVGISSACDKLKVSHTRNTLVEACQNYLWERTRKSSRSSGARHQVGTRVGASYRCTCSVLSLSTSIQFFLKYFIYPCYTPFLISGHGIYAFDVDETTGALTASGVCPVSVCGSNPS